MARISLVVVVILLLLGCAAVESVTQPTTSSTKTREPIEWGVYTPTPAALLKFDSWAGRPLNLVATFIAFDDPFPSEFATQTVLRGKTLLIFWEPTSGYKEISSGAFDRNIRAFKEDAKKYGQPIILVPFNEPNLNEESWGYGQGDNTPAGFIDAWRHVHLELQDVPNIKFGIAFNNVSVPDIADNAMEKYYPGDSYVDYVGLDGFNFDEPWQTPQEIFDQGLARVSGFKKPVYLFSIASAEGKEKPQWIREFFNWLSLHSEIRGFVWFNENKEKDWRIDSDPASEDAFVQGLKNL